MPVCRRRAGWFNMSWYQRKPWQRLSEHTSVDVLELFCPSWWETVFWFQWYVHWRVEACYVKHTPGFSKPFWKKKFKKSLCYWIQLAASILSEVIFSCSTAGRFLLFHSFLCIIVNILFLPWTETGDICHSWCAAWQKIWRLNSCKAKLLLYMIMSL